MSVGLSRDQKLALSYVEDAKRYLPVLHEEGDRFAVDTMARQILNDELAKAQRLLEKAAHNGEDVTGLRICLVGIEAGIAEEAVDKWRQDRTHDGFEHWQEWTKLCLSTNKELVDLDPSPSTHLMYGWALFNAYQDQEALMPLRIAEQGDNDEASIQASKLIAEIARRSEDAAIGSVRSHTGNLPSAEDSIFVRHGLQHLTPQVRQTVLDFIKQGNLTMALLEMKKATGVDFDYARAKSAVDGIAAEQGVQVSGGCYIATACYGRCDHPDVLVFRRFRDECLMTSALGRMLIQMYYKTSPPLAARLDCITWLSYAIRRSFLEPLARLLR